MFLEAIAAQAADAVALAERLTHLRQRYRSEVRAVTRGLANRLVDLAFEHPVLTTGTVESRLDVSRPAALDGLRQVEDLHILRPDTPGPRRQLRWRAAGVLEILTEEGP